MLETTDALQETPVVTARLPVVTIVGRPNAGKSTLFNRLVPGQRAIVDPTPGVTRDRNIAPVQWDDRSFLLVDTGGFEDRDKTSLAESVRSQSAIASEESDAIVVLLDGRAGLHPDDRTLVERVRRLRKPIFYAVNKLDVPKHEDDMVEFYGLGIDEIFPVSAAHGRGVRDLFDRVVEVLPEPESESAGAGAIRLAIIGRPNVGKSSLVNRLVGFERSVVDSTPGTTRDALDTPFRYGETDYVLVDTAGIRRRPRVHEHVERVSVVRALRALESAELAVLVVDAVEGMTDQDARISGYAWDRR
ncbi:MAG TPA: ribosome biogenesis GTPase Der, partial [Terriglobales bacterium]|nr:ribosome biogenesis GTPase Der [Terriglobales bacterium]